MCPAALPLDAAARLLHVLHAGLLRWCIARFVRLANPVTLTAIALYHAPRHALLASVLGERLPALLG